MDDPEGVSIDSKDNIYVADTDNDRILKFDSNGKFITKWGSYGEGSTQFNSPSGISIDSKDNIYVADTDNDRILKFDSTCNSSRNGEVMVIVLDSLTSHSVYL